jgi:hypothetical protein
MKPFLFICFLITSVFSACRVQDEVIQKEEILLIKHGYTFGRCVGYCNKETTFSQVQVRHIQYNRDTLKNPPKISEKKILAEDFKALCTSVDLTAFLQMEERIGCPDCADQGAEYVEIVTSKQTKRVTFEPGKPVPILDSLLIKLRAGTMQMERSKMTVDR